MYVPKDNICRAKKRTLKNLHNRRWLQSKEIKAHANNPNLILSMTSSLKYLTLKHLCTPHRDPMKNEVTLKLGVDVSRQKTENHINTVLIQSPEKNRASRSHGMNGDCALITSEDLLLFWTECCRDKHLAGDGKRGLSPNHRDPLICNCLTT